MLLLLTKNKLFQVAFKLLGNIQSPVARLSCNLIKFLFSKKKQQQQQQNSSGHFVILLQKENKIDFQNLKSEVSKTEANGHFIAMMRGICFFFYIPFIWQGSKKYMFINIHMTIKLSIANCSCYYVFMQCGNRM